MIHVLPQPSASPPDALALSERFVLWERPRLDVLPPRCGPGASREAHLLAALRRRLFGGRGACPAPLSGTARAALADLAAPMKAAGLRLPPLPSAAPRCGVRSAV